MERLGIPAAVVITDVFRGLLASFAANLGVPGYPPVTVQHPISAKDDETLARAAREISDSVARRLLAPDAD